MNGQHCENYYIKRETIHCYLRNVLSTVACDWRWPDVLLESQHDFVNLLLFVLLDKKSLNDWSLGEQGILFPLGAYHLSE